MTAGTSIAHRFADAFHTRDPARVADVITPDARYRDLFYGDQRGRAAIRDLFVRTYEEGHDHRWEMALPGGRAIGVVHRGPLTSLAAAYRVLLDAAGPHASGPVVEWYAAAAPGPSTPDTTGITVRTRAGITRSTRRG